MKLRTLLVVFTLLTTTHAFTESNQELCVVMNNELRSVGNLIKDIWNKADYTPLNSNFISLLENNDGMIPCNVFLGALQETDTLVQGALIISQNDQLRDFHHIIAELMDQILSQLPQVQSAEEQQDTQTTQEPVVVQNDVPEQTESQTITTEPIVERVLKAIHGTIQADGNIVAGTGFSVNQSSVGVYAITFDNAFSDTFYQVFVTPSVGINRRVNVTNTSTQIVTVSTCNDGGTATAQQFNFLAIGF